VTCVDTKPEAGLERKMTIVTERKSVVVLVVEDDNDMRSLLCDELWSEGYQLREAKDGDEALRAVLESVPDLILTDLKMPAGGFDYVSRLKTFAPQCPIVLMTAFGGTQTKADALKWGASAYFDKPVRISELKATVRHLLATKLV
jgi:DNA-binding response OmpR family regulator